ncbi:histidine--tRNA ligase [Opitutales bacterium]|nr:histidine--tRNA ligase [Opitutales bacterium]MDA8991142.1 histidine--tRNA ligase [Opitutales bacterium]
MFDTLPGFRDFPPEACARRNHLFRVFRNVARAFDFREFDAPILEPLDLYIEKSGPEIAAQLFHFEDKGERSVALRPELTPTLARMVAAQANALPKPIKWYNIGEHFRYERPQKGRGRSFYQFNADLLGEASIGADAELIALLGAIMQTLGLGEKEFAIRLSDRQTWILFLDDIGIDLKQRPSVLDAIDKSGRRKPEQTIESLNLAVPGKGEQIFQKIEEIKQINDLDTLLIKLDSFGIEGQARAKDWQNLMSELTAHQVNPFVKIDLSIVRGLAYYTGFVYEAFEASGEGRALAGGGRYDHLIKKLSGNVDLPATGFAIGDMTLSDCLEKNGLLPSYIMAPDIFVISGQDQRNSGIFLTAKTRKSGFAVSHSLKATGFGKQFKEAGKSGARYALIIGEEEEIQKKVKIKDLKSSGEISVDQTKLIQQLEKIDEEGGINSSE